jgi:polysaccharide export outer membrane protein
MMKATAAASSWCFLAMLCTSPFLTPSARAQAPLETQQQANDRIKNLSRATVAPPRDYIIGRGDLVGVEVYDVPELSRELRVSQTGTIGMPLLPVRLYVAGLTEVQLQQKIAEVLQANGLVTTPRVLVSVKEKKSKPITIVGAVVHPMVYQADRSVTLIQVLAEAGGIAPDAGDVVIITRGNSNDTVESNEPPEIGAEDAIPVTLAQDRAAQQTSESPSSSLASADPGTSKKSEDTTAAASTPPQITAPQNDSNANVPPAVKDAGEIPPPVNIITVNISELLERGDTQNNIPLQGGDVVTIPHAGIVYALGAVQRPGGFVANNDRAQLSALKVLALAGGMTRIAKKAHAVIIRKDAAGKQQAIPLDLGRIVTQKSEDVRLMPSDILYIPDNATKAALIRAGEIGLAVGTSLTVYRLGTK